MEHYAYLLRCADGTIYSGYTTNLARRVQAHNQGSGAKYTRARLPVTLAYYEAFASKHEAMQREAALKKLTHAQKEALILRGNART
nr:GIY-YIG nuclease family protein [Maliibacterium massiliense]